MAILAKDIMTAPVISVNGETSLKEATEKLDENHFSGMPVVDDDHKLVGILSETDILRYTQQIIGQPLRDPHRVFTRGQEVLHLDITHRGVEIIELIASTTVDKLMSADVLSVNENDPVYEIVALMEKHDINRIPVVNQEGKLSGIVTRADIVKAMVKHWKSINKD